MELQDVLGLRQERRHELSEGSGWRGAASQDDAAEGATAVSRQPLRGKPLQKGIIHEARLKGWRVAHFPAIRVEWGYQTPVAADGKGFPDLLLVRDRVIVAEVKGDGDSLKPHQALWIEAFQLAGQEVYVWTPRDWRDGVIERILSSRSREEAATARDEQLVIRGG